MFFSCRKEVTKEPQVVAGSVAVDEIRTAFEQSALQSKLSSPFRDSLSLNLSPVWSKVGQRKMSDSITYYYVPLVHFLTDPGGRLVSLRTTGFEEYLIVRQNSLRKDNLKFYKAKYASTDSLRSAGRGGYSYESFTGYLALDNFSKSALFQFKDGQLVHDGRRAPGQPSTERWVCDQECQWFSYCSGADLGGGFYTVTTTYGRSGNQCDYPWTGLPDCGFAGATPTPWSLTSSTEVNCVYFDDDVPPPPDGGGGGGDGETFTFLPTSPVIIAPLENSVAITNIQAYIKCFQDGKPSAGYRITIYGDAPSGGGVYKANPVTKNIEDVGHSFVTFTKENTDGTAVNQTMGFYPSSTATVTTPSRGVMYDDSRHSYDVGVSVIVNKDVFDYALDYARQTAEGADYHILDYNCTSFAVGVGQRIGLNIPTGYRVWGTYNNVNYSGVCPAGLVEDMKSSSWNPNIGTKFTPTRVTSVAAASKGPCP